MDSNDWKKFEKTVTEKDSEQFYKLMEYWNFRGKEYAYNDATTELHLLFERPLRDNVDKRTEFINLLFELQLGNIDNNADSAALLNKGQEMLNKAVKNGDKEKAKMISRFIYLLGEETATCHIKKLISESLTSIDVKRKDALIYVTQAQKDLGFFEEQSWKNEEE